jgi:lactoylglutathione lyase
MKSPLLGLRTAIYHVGDIGQAKTWYTKAFMTDPYFDEPFYVGYSIAGYELGLQPGEDSSKDKGENVVAYWGVNDIRSEYDRFLAAGATAHEPPQEVGGGIQVATVKDPWGNVIGLIYNPHFKLQ